MIITGRGNRSVISIFLQLDYNDRDKIILLLFCYASEIEESFIYRILKSEYGFLGLKMIIQSFLSCFRFSFVLSFIFSRIK